MGVVDRHVPKVIGRRRPNLPRTTCERLPNNLQIDMSLIELTHPVLTKPGSPAYVLALHHGRAFQALSVAEAILFIRIYNESKAVGTVYRYEVSVRYTNGDEVSGEFASRVEAIGLLEGLRVDWQSIDELNGICPKLRWPLFRFPFSIQLRRFTRLEHQRHGTGFLPHSFGPGVSSGSTAGPLNKSARRGSCSARPQSDTRSLGGGAGPTALRRIANLGIPRKRRGGARSLMLPLFPSRGAACFPRYSVRSSG